MRWMSDTALPTDDRFYLLDGLEVSFINRCVNQGRIPNCRLLLLRTESPPHLPRCNCAIREEELQITALPFRAVLLKL